MAIDRKLAVHAGGAPRRLRGRTRPGGGGAEVERRIAAVDDPSIFIARFDGAALSAMAAALGDFDPTRPLWGVPFAVKDNIDVAGLPTTAACPAFAYGRSGRLRGGAAAGGGGDPGRQDQPRPVRDRARRGADALAGAAQRARSGARAGRVVVGVGGRGGARGRRLRLGTDTAGSGRVPAGLNNIVGLKPSLGAISPRGVVPACRTLDTISVFALTVDDAWAAFRAAAAFDPDDPYARPVDVGALGARPVSPAVGVPVAGEPAVLRRCGAGGVLRRDGCGAGGDRRAHRGGGLRAVLRGGRMLYEGAWVAERHVVGRAAARPRAGGGASGDPVDRRAGCGALRGGRLPRVLPSRGAAPRGRAGPGAPRPPLRADLPDLRDAGRDRRRPDRAERAARDLHQLRQPPRPLRPSRADAGTQRRPSRKRDPAGQAGRDGLLASLGREIERWGDRRLGATGWTVPAAGTPPAFRTTRWRSPSAAPTCRACHLTGS